MPVLAVQGGKAGPASLPSAASAAAKLCGLAATGLVLLSSGAAEANVVKVAEFSASGLIFKDSVELLAFDDKEGKGSFVAAVCVLRANCWEPADPGSLSSLRTNCCHGVAIPAVDGVTIYLTDFKRSITEKLSKV